MARRPWQLGPHRPAAAGAGASERTALWWFVSQISLRGESPKDTGPPSAAPESRGNGQRRLLGPPDLTPGGPSDAVCGAPQAQLCVTRLPLSQVGRGAWGRPFPGCTARGRKPWRKPRVCLGRGPSPSRPGRGGPGPLPGQHCAPLRRGRSAPCQAGLRGRGRRGTTLGPPSPAPQKRRLTRVGGRRP